MTRKTYGVSGLMDWTTQIKAGKATITVHFTGGALTAYGVTPATYSTSDAFFQRVIEGSAQFRSGKIALLSAMEVGGDKGAADATPTGAKGRADDATPTGAVRGEADAEEATAVEVPDRYDAVEYLKEHFPGNGYTATSLRTKTAFEAACRSCGVRFVFTTENEGQ